jgi:hypothetical protein
MMLRVWRESDGKELVRIVQPDSKLPTFRPAPPQLTGPDAWRNRILSQTQDGKVVVREQFAVHFGSSDWYSTRVEELATQQVLREFPYTGGRAAELSPDGSRLSTVENVLGSAPFVAVWCR